MSDFIKKENFIFEKEFLGILDAYSYIKETISKLDKDDYLYNTKMKSCNDYLKTYEEEYDEISENWKDYFEDYLFDEMPEEYKEKILHLNKLNI